MTDNLLLIGKRIKIPFTITNNGNRDAYNLKISLFDEDYNSTIKQRHEYKRLEANSRKDFEITLIEDKPGIKFIKAEISYISENGDKGSDAFGFKLTVCDSSKEYKYIDDSFIAGRIIQDEKMFVGRKNLINELKTTICNKNFIIPGPRRIGKSSLLNMINKGAFGEQDFYTLLFDMQQQSAYLENCDDFIKGIMIDISEYLSSRGFDLHFNTDTSNEELYKHAIDFMKEVNSMLKQKDKILILLFDEFEYCKDLLAKAENRFFNIWRSTLNKSSNIRLIISGYLRIKKYDFWAEIGMESNGIDIEEFSIKDIEELFKTYLNDSIFIDNLVYEKIHKLSGGNPYIVQCLGSEMVHYANSKKQSFIFEEDIRSIKNQYLSRGNMSHFKWQYSDLNENEQNTLKCIIQFMKNQDMKLDDYILQPSGIDTESLNSLENDKQILSRNNGIRFKIPLFKDYIELYQIDKAESY